MSNLNEFKKILMNDFSSNEIKWMPWLNVIAKEYYLCFLKNDALFQEMINYVIKKKKKNKEEIEIEIKIILGYKALFDALNYDENSKQITYKKDLINNFKEVDNDTLKNKIKEAYKGLEDNLNSVYRENDYLNEITKKFNLFLNFYKNKDFREQYFLDVIYKENDYDETVILNKLMNNNNFYVVNNN